MLWRVFQRPRHHGEPRGPSRNSSSAIFCIEKPKLLSCWVRQTYQRECALCAWSPSGLCTDWQLVGNRQKFGPVMKQPNCAWFITCAFIENLRSMFHWTDRFIALLSERRLTRLERKRAHNFVAVWFKVFLWSCAGLLSQIMNFWDMSMMVVPDCYGVKLTESYAARMTLIFFFIGVQYGRRRVHIIEKKWWW